MGGHRRASRPRPSGLCETIAWQLGPVPVRAVEGNIPGQAGRDPGLARAADIGPRPGPARVGSRRTRTADGIHLVPGFNGLGRPPWWDPGTHGAADRPEPWVPRLENVARAAPRVPLPSRFNDLLIAIREVTGETGSPVRRRRRGGQLDADAVAGRPERHLGAASQDGGTCRRSAPPTWPASRPAGGAWTTSMPCRGAERRVHRPPRARTGGIRERTSWRAAIQRARYQPQREDPREDPKEGP